MAAVKNQNNSNTAELVRDAATGEAAAILGRLATTPNGLSASEAAERLEEFGPNEVAQETKHEWLGGYTMPCAIRW